MDEKPQISMEEYIPTDRFAIQDMYLMRIHNLGLLYEKIMRAKYNKQIDPRAIIDFFALADSFFFFARPNIVKHLGEKDMQFLSKVFESGTQVTDIRTLGESALPVYKLFQVFAFKSKLTDLSAKRWKGEFAHARAKLGLEDGKGGNYGENEY